MEGNALLTTGALHFTYRGTSLIRNCRLLTPYSRTMTRGVGVFLSAKYPSSVFNRGCRV